MISYHSIVPATSSPSSRPCRLLADAVQSYIILYSPAVIGSALRSWPLAPLISHSLTLATPAGRTTAPNSDTVYSISRIELAQVTN